MAVDFDFIEGLEGGLETSAYVPVDENGNALDSSGPTVGIGIDLGSKTPESLLAIGVPPNIISKIPDGAFGKQGSAALAFVQSNPFSLEEDEARLLSEKVKDAELEVLRQEYADNAGKSFDSLPPRLQTVAASIAYQYGPTLDQTPSFKQALFTGDHEAILSELSDFGDKYPTRRLKEAAYLVGVDPKDLQEIAGIGFWDRDGKGGPQTSQALKSLGVEKFAPLVEEDAPDMVAFSRENNIGGTPTGLSSVRNPVTRNNIVEILRKFGTSEGMRRIQDTISGALGAPVVFAEELNDQAVDAINLASNDNPELLSSLLEEGVAPLAEVTAPEETDLLQEGEDLARSFAQGALQGISDIPRALGVAFQSDSLTNAANAIDSIVDAPEGEAGFIDQVARGLGQVVTMIGGGLVGGTVRGTSRLAAGVGAKRLANARGVAALDKLMFPGASAAAMGGAEQVRDYYDTQREKGVEVDRDTELTALYAGAVIGSLDLLFPGRILKTGTLGKFTKNFDDWASKGRLRSAGAGALVEGSTEAAQASLSNGLGNALYDADNDLGQFINDALNEGGVGGAVGAILGAILPRGIGKAGGATPRKITDDTAAENVNIIGEPEVSGAVETVNTLEDTPTDENPLPSSTSNINPTINPPSVVEMNDETMQLVGNTVEGRAQAHGNRVVQNEPPPQSVRELGEEYRAGQRNSSDIVYQEAVMSSYEGVIDRVTSGEIDSYEQLVTEAQISARKEIESILDSLNIELVQGAPYQDIQSLADDVAANRQQRFVQDKGGLLDSFIDPTTKRVTHAEALQAIMDSVGRLNAKVGYGYSGDQNAYNQVHAMFSPLAQVIVATQLRGRIANQYTLPANRQAMTRLTEIDNEIADNGASPKLLKQRAKVVKKLSRTNAPHFILKSQFTRPELPGADRNTAPDEDMDLLSVLHETPVRNERQNISEYYRTNDPLRSEELGNSFRNFVEAKLPESITESRAGQFILDKIQFDILNAQDPSLHHHIRSVEGGKEVAAFKAKDISENFDEATERYIKSPASDIFGKTEEEKRAAINRMQSDVATGEIQFELINPEGYIRESNMVRSGDGYSAFMYHGAHANPDILDGPPSNVVIPQELVVALQPYVNIMDTYRGYEKENVRNQMAQTAANLTHVTHRIEALSSRLARSIRQGISLKDINYSVFDPDVNVRQEWKEIIKGESETYSYVPAILQDYFDDIAADLDLKLRSGENEKHAGLRVAKRFFDAVDSSNSITEFNSKTSGIFGTLSRGMDTQALLGLGAYANKRDANKMWSELGKEKQMAEHLSNQEKYLKKLESNMFYFGRAYRAHHDPDWVARMANPQTKEEQARYDAYVQEVADTLAKKEGRKVGRLLMDRATQMVQDYVRDIKNNNANLISHQSRIEGGAQIASPSMRKGVVSKTLREFLGEYTDPSEILEVSINRLSDMSVTKRANNKVYEMFLGNGLYEDLESAPEEERASLVEIKLPDKHNLSKFQGMYAQPVIAHTIGSFVENEVAKGMMGVLQKTSGQFRQWNTIYSIATANANIIAGMTGILSTGGAFNMFRTDSSVNAGKIYLELMKAIQSGNIDYLDEAIGAVGGSEAHVRDIMQHQRLAKNAASVVLSSLRNQPVPVASDAAGLVQDKVWEPFSGFMHSLYKFGDLAPKVYGYYFNKEIAMSKLGLDEDAAKDFATKITRDTLFDYDQVPHFVKVIRDLSPLGGGFLSWQTLTFTTTYHTARYVRQIAALESRAWGFRNITGFDPANTEHTRQAKKGFLNSGEFATSATMMKSGGLLSGMMMHVLMGTIIAGAGGLISAMFGDDDTDQDLQAIRMKEQFQMDKAEFVKNMSNLMPEYYKDTSKSIVDINGLGNVEFINTSRLSNYGNFVEAFNGLMRDDIGDDEALKDFIFKMFGDYANAAFGLQLLNELYNNETQFGQQISPPDASLMEQIARGTAHSLDYVFINSSFEQIGEQVMSLFSEDDYNKHTGQPVNLTNSFLELAGLRKIEFDPKKAFASQSWQDSTKNSQSRKFLSDKLKSYNQMSDAQIAGELARAKKTHEETYEKMLERIESAKFFGMSEEDIKEILKPISFFGKNNTELLLRGQIPAFQMKQIGDSRIASNRLKGLSGNARDNFQYNYERARTLNNE